MIQRELNYYARQFLDETPTHSIASVMASVEDGYACFKLSDGEAAATIDFFFRNASEAVQAEKKMLALKKLVSEFCAKLSIELAALAPSLDCQDEQQMPAEGITP